MAKEKWTVFYGQQAIDNQKPLLGWAEKALKVAKIGAGTALEKNTPYILAERGVFKTAQPQTCNFVTVEAESAEEASLVVDKFLSQNGVNAEAGGGGPSVKSAFVNSGGKAIACKSSALEETAVA